MPHTARFQRLRAGATEVRPAGSAVFSADPASEPRPRGLPRLSKRRRRTRPAASAQHVIAVASEAPSKDLAEEGFPGPLNDYEGETAVVVGAGPAGACAACYLAARGFKVKIFERRGDPNIVPVTSHRSIIITLRQETLNILTGLGVELPAPDDKEPISGLIRFGGVGTLGAKGIKSQPSPDTRRSILAERHAIARAILTAVQRRHTDRIQFSFDNQCQGVDFDNRVAEFKGADGSIVRERFDLLVGADGAKSNVRKALVDHDSLFNVETRKVTRMYKSLRGLPPPEQEDIREIVQNGRMAFLRLKRQRRNGKKTPPQITVYGAEDGNVNGIMSYFDGDLVSIQGREEEWLRGVAPKDFPEPWIPLIAEQLQISPGTVAGPVTRCSSFVGPRAILLGDAAHSVTPAMGIGCNMAIEDAVVLDKALGNAQGDLDAAVEEFNALRYEAVQDAQDLQETIPFAGIEVLSLVTPFVRAAAGLHLLFHLGAGKILPQIIPKGVYDKYIGGEVTASQALARIRSEAFLLGALTFAAAVVAIRFCVKLALGA